MFSEDIIIRPLMTEKCVAMQDSEHKYAFQVTIAANKIQIKKAVEKLFNVEVKNVHTMNYLGKKVSRRVKRSRVEGKKSNWKKAIVTLKEGFDIDFFKDAM
ncbi:50S ribosomal protein L23 [Myxococcota bacterium]|nr:50S ribosomal protein L23 [Myxococcota bacterium]